MSANVLSYICVRFDAVRAYTTIVQWDGISSLGSQRPLLKASRKRDNFETFISWNINCYKECRRNGQIFISTTNLTGALIRPKTADMVLNTLQFPSRSTPTAGSDQFEVLINIFLKNCWPFSQIWVAKFSEKRLPVPEMKGNDKVKYFFDASYCKPRTPQFWSDSCFLLPKSLTYV